MALFWLFLPLSCLVCAGAAIVLINGSLFLTVELKNICDHTDEDIISCCNGENPRKDDHCPVFDCEEAKPCRCETTDGAIVCFEHKPYSRGLAMVIVGAVFFLCCFFTCAACTGLWVRRRHKAREKARRQLTVSVHNA
ncbi:hypothetical protein QOT17_006200 [Balamuthia mandrillaris]